MDTLSVMIKNYKTFITISLLIVLAYAARTFIFPKIAGKVTPRPLNSSAEKDTTFVDTYPNQVIENLWIAYRDKIQKDGRVIDRSRDYLTTSEGQSYGLLRSVWMDDKETFDRVLKWTTNNLGKREGDKLFAWKWGKNKDGNWDILYDEGGVNTASDADQDIALALIFAFKRWNDTNYLTYATEILNDIWDKEVLELKGEYYMLAGNWAKGEPSPTINPSYFSFAAYNVFAQADPYHPWIKLKETSYRVLTKATESPLNYSTSANIPPDWVSLNRETGEIFAVVHDDKTTNFSDDAFRTVWRVGLDWKWYKNPAALEYLNKLTFLKNEWRNNNRLLGSYKHNGDPEVEYESYSMYGSVLSYYESADPELGSEVYERKIAPLYNTDTEEFTQELGYYSENWVWFGMALYHNKLVNLFDTIKP